MQEFWFCFVPLFIAVDAIGILPYFITLTESLDKKDKRKVLIQSVITALIVALIFITIGELILRFLGITIADFMIAGGVLMFVISISDILSREKRQRMVDMHNLGAVPIGVPLIVGPAVLTTSIILVRSYGFFNTAISLTLNIIIAGVIFWLSIPFNRFLGKNGSKIISKLANMLLAAIGIMLVRKGIELAIKSFS